MEAETQAAGPRVIDARPPGMLWLVRRLMTAGGDPDDWAPNVPAAPMLYAFLSRSQALACCEDLSLGGGRFVPYPCPTLAGTPSLGWTVVVAQESGVEDRTSLCDAGRRRLIYPTHLGYYRGPGVPPGGDPLILGSRAAAAGLADWLTAKGQVLDDGRGRLEFAWAVAVPA